jgi:hypothetical protein
MSVEPTPPWDQNRGVNSGCLALNRYLGVAVGENLGCMFTGLWTALAGLALIQSEVLHPLFGWSGSGWRRCLCSGRWNSSAGSRCVAGAGRHPGPIRLHRLVGVAAGLAILLLITA